MTPRKLAKSSLLRILLPLGLALGAVFFTVRQANVLLQKALQATFGEHAGQFESVWFDWNGNVTAKQVVLRPHDAAPGAAEVRFERVWLDTGGWGFFLRHAFDRSLASAAMPRLHLVFGDARVLDGLAALVPELGPAGPASGSMFEAEGCGRSSEGFTRESLVAMGLSPGGTSLEIDRSVDGDAMQMLVALATPGSSRTQLDRRGRLEAPRASLLGEPALPRIESERWTVRDQGFVAARNRFCASADGITPRDTLERHIAAIDQRMQQAGLAVDDNAKAFYRRFARSGGEMSFGGAYQPPLSVAEARAGREGGRALARMNATLERDTRAVPIVWRVVPASAMPGDTAVAQDPAAAPASDATNASDVDATAASAPALPPVSPAADSAASVSEPPATGSATPAVAIPPESAPPVAETPTPPAPQAEPVAAAPESDVAEPEPNVAAPPAPTPPVAAPPPRSGAPRIERAPPATRRESLSFEDLSRHAGRQVRIWTMHNPPRTVHILGGDASEIRVRAKLGGGQAEYTVKREGFLRATLVR